MTASNNDSHNRRPADRFVGDGPFTPLLALVQLVFGAVLAGWALSVIAHSPFAGLLARVGVGSVIYVVRSLF